MPKIEIMKKIFPAIFFILVNLILANEVFPYNSDSDSTPVEKYGQIRVEGNRIVDKNGNPVALHGMSLFWSQWIGKYYNPFCIEWLHSDWKITVIRAAMGIEPDGYLTNPDTEKNKIFSVINKSIDLGIYVIVDWHDHNAHIHQEEAIGFFAEIAALYGDQPNLIYEIYNEPTQVSWSNVVKPYAEAVIDTIRSIDPDNLIIVGTPTWSQDVDIAANDPLEYNNIAYALHFYAATHKQSLRNKASSALGKGAALFVSEWGTCESSGTGKLDTAETEKWLNFMEQNKLSWCNWSIADKNETSAALKGGASEFGEWNDTDLSASGDLIRKKLIFLSDSVSTDIGFINPFQSFKLIQNYPNPFNPSTKIVYQLGRKSHVVIRVFDILGNEVATLVNVEKSAGVYEAEFKSNENNKNLSSGIYFCRFEADNFFQIKKMVLIK